MYAIRSYYGACREVRGHRQHAGLERLAEGDVRELEQASHDRLRDVGERRDVPEHVAGDRPVGALHQLPAEPVAMATDVV